ncbi:hypothetical protein CDV55_100640 [Aspergillus turcosus]|nr:hypothetical protein CDV55_100640 [Aspergillus turcosus]
MSCTEVGNPNSQAMMRVYVQIPDANTEFEDADIRRQQASTVKPRELLAYQTFARSKEGSKYTPQLVGYKEDRQDNSGLVPGGFITSFAWKPVPGLRLGDYTGNATAFRELERSERDEIRRVFKETFPEFIKMGIFPASAGPDNLIWNSHDKALFFVDFEEWNEIKPQPWKDSWLPRFDLVKVPDIEWSRSDWDGDTSSWEF